MENEKVVQEEVKVEQPQAEEVQQPQQAEPTKEAVKAEEGEKQVKMFTEEEVAKMIQSQADKRVTEALKTAKGKWEEEYKNQLAKEKAEAERLAQMTAEERQKEEFARIQKEIDIERAEFQKQREDFEKEKLMLQTVKQLSEKGIPANFADFLVTGNAEQTAANLAAFEVKWTEMLQSNIESHVNERLKAVKQPQVATENTQIMSKKQFARLPYAERKKMMDENPDLVKQILNS